MQLFEIGMILFFIVVITGLLYMNYRSMEGFLNGSAYGTFAPRCGVEFPACPNGMKCINGYCAVNAPPPFPHGSGLPVFP